MSTDRKFRRLSFLTLVLALTSVVFVFIYFPPQTSVRWLVALTTLFALAVLSSYLALTVTEGGASTAVDFLAHLAAILILGPAGALALTIVEHILTEFLLLRKSVYRATFNLSQVVIATAAAGIAYRLFGGIPSLDVLEFRDSFPPFVIAVVAYWTVNSIAASYALGILAGC